LQPFVFFHRAQSARGAQFADNPVFTALIVSGWPEVARRRGFHLNALKVTVKGKIKIQARLLAVRHHVQTGGRLIVQRGDDGVILRLGDIG